MEAAEEEVERLEAELARSSAVFRVQLDDRRFGHAQLVQLLPRQSASVSFVRYMKHGRRSRPAAAHYVAIVQQADTVAPQFVDLGSAALLEQLGRPSANVTRRSKIP